MKTHYHCGKCKELFEATAEHFFPHSLKKVTNNSNLTVIGQCKKCANQYATQWRAATKAKGLVRSQRTTLAMAGAVTGTVYVIGPDVLGSPYKIGITSGSDTRRRQTALQTANWVELKLVWKSKLLDRADLVERKLHKHFEKKRVRGEWFNITKKDINSLTKLVEHFGVNE